MADVDTSSYPRPGPPANPLDQILKTGQVADTLGQFEVGKGIQQAIQPDGTIDRNVLAQVLKGSIAGSMQAPKALNALETLRNAGYSADAQGLLNFNERMGLISRATSHIIDDPSKDGVMRGLSYLANPINGADKVGMGIPQIAEAARHFYDSKGNLLPPAQLAKVAKQFNTQAQSSMEALKLHLPGSENVDTGQRIVTAPTGTPMNPAIGRTVQREIPPTAEQPGPNNQPTFRGTQPPSTGADVQMPGQRGQPDITKRITGYQGMPATVMSGGKSVTLAQPGDGTQSPGSAPSFADRYSAAYGPYGIPRGGAAAPAPGFQTATEGEAQNSARMAAELQTANNEAPATKAIIGNLEKEAKNFSSGPLADYKRIGKSFALANLPIPSSLKKEGAIFDPASVADQESFNKNIFNLVQSQFKALGGTGTDAKLDSASHTSPSELMSQVGVKNILSLLKGNQDAIQAKTKAWNAWRQANGPQSYPQFAEDFNSKFDPRAFQFKYMTPTQRQEYYNKIDDPSERRELLKRVEYAHDAGWVKY